MKEQKRFPPLRCKPFYIFRHHSPLSPNIIFRIHGGSQQFLEEAEKALPMAG